MSKVLHLFAGGGGSHLAGRLLGWRSVGSVEIDPYCRALLRLHYPNEHIHDDVRTYHASHLKGQVDGVVGGFPCQDISCAGKGKGIGGERSGLWKEFVRIIKEAEPKWAFIENSPMLRTRGLDVVLRDLASIGLDAEWATYSATAVGAPHRRDRMWILAYSAKVLSNVCETHRGEVSEPGNGRVSSVADTDETYHKGVGQQSCGISEELTNSHGTSGWWTHDPADVPQSQVGRVVDGLAAPLVRWNRTHALAALGNGWVPQQAAEAFRQLMQRVAANI